MLTEKKLYRDFEFYKEEAQKLLSRGEIEDCLHAMKLACAIAKNYYLCYADDTLENLSMKCSEIIFRSNSSRTYAVGEAHRYVFYDTHTTDNVALTQQYLAALIEWKVDFLYLTTKDLSGTRTKIICETLHNCPRATVVVLPDNLSLTEQAKGIVKQVEEYGATEAFIQTTSDDVAGVVAWAALNGVKKYYIDLSDHSFWLGTKAFDYFITFRSYGYNICVQHRGLKEGQILVQPFYPILTDKEYKGIPETIKNSVKILSGGRYDKIYGEDNMYFNLVESILKQNPQTELYFAGGGAFGKLGQSTYIKKQLRARQISNRFHLLGFRDDIVELMKRADIYVGTYPMGGGLMTQVAASQGLPIVQYATPGLSSSVQEFLDMEKGESFVFESDPDGFLARVRELVSDERERASAGEVNKRAVLTEADFVVQLRETMEGKAQHRHIDEYPVDCKELRENQIEVENHYFPSYPRSLVKSSYVRKYQRLRYMKSVILFIWYSDKKWLLKKVLGY